MRYEIARKLAEAFDNVEDGVTVNVSFDNASDNIRVTVRKVWYGVTLVPMKDLANVDDVRSCDILMTAAEKSLQLALKQLDKPVEPANG